jgi:hypothetical protein
MPLEPTFTVSVPGSQDEAMERLADRARDRGLTDLLLADGRLMRERLVHDPLGWGDPVYGYHHLKLIVHRAVLDLIQVYYAVDPARRIVYVQQISAVPGRPLAD